MTNGNIAEIMMRLMRQVDEIVKQLGKKKLTYRIDNEGYGIFIKNKIKEEVLWFGIDYKAWNNIGTPLTIGVDAYNEEIYSKNYEEPFFNCALKNKDKVEELDLGDDAYFYYIPLPFKDYDTTDTIVTKIEEVTKELRLN